MKGYTASSDILVHNFIKSNIYSIFPNDLIYSEEDNDLFSCNQENSKYVWVLDPICGTANFIRGIPFYVHSLSVLDDDGVLYAGVYDANRNELFLADRNRTTLNGNGVGVSKTRDLDKSVISVNCNQAEFNNKNPKVRDLVNTFAPPTTRRLHIMDCGNLEMAYVACGRLDAYINFEDKIWEIAAGSLMISSAGGKIKILRGSIDIHNPANGIIASNGFLMNTLLEKLSN